MLLFQMEKIKIDAKIKIKDSAIKLFNTQETLSVTTNHIAKEAGISPGNLYYHYKNKEEIITSLYMDLSKKFEEINSFENILISSNPLKALHNTFELLSKIFYEYRFLLRDSMVLISLYPSLKESFTKNQEKRIQQIQGILQFLIKEDILRFEDNTNLEKRAKMHWFITAYWQTFASSTGEVSIESIKDAKEVFFEFMIYPFLTKKGKGMLVNINR
jgi:AcrR family transcriptional regulator